MRAPSLLLALLVVTAVSSVAAKAVKEHHCIHGHLLQEQQDKNGGVYPKVNVSYNEENLRRVWRSRDAGHPVREGLQHPDHVPLSHRSKGPAQTRDVENAVHVEGGTTKSTSSSTTIGGAATAPIRFAIDNTYLLTDDANKTCYFEGQVIFIGDEPDEINGDSECLYSYSKNCWLRCEQEHLYTASFGDYIMDKLLVQATEWLSSALSVVPLEENLVIPYDGERCGSKGGVPIPEQYIEYWGEGAAADMLLLVTARPTVGSLLAYATKCITDQYGRPIVGHVNFAPNAIEVTADVEASELGVAIHELVHALGFTFDSFSTFVDSDGNPIAQSEIVEHNMLIGSDHTTYPLNQPEKTYTTKAIKSPLVMAAAEEHYGCSIAASGNDSGLAGVPLENGGGDGTANTHWDKRIAMDEFMTGTSSGSPKYSKLTLALLEDSGWYMANTDAATDWEWGRDKGCDFIEQRCEPGNWPDERYICDDTQDGTRFCTFDRNARGDCDLTEYSETSLDEEYRYFGDANYIAGRDALADYCPIIYPYENGDCRDRSNVSPTSDGAYGAHFDPTSACFVSSLIGNDYQPLKDDDVRCYSRGCDSVGDLWVHVGLVWARCRPGAALKIPNFSGDVECPTEEEIDEVCGGFADFTFPAITAVKPKRIDFSGGTRVTIDGTGFTDEMLVTVGGVECRNIALLVNSLTCTLSDYSWGYAPSGDYDSAVVMYDTLAMSFGDKITVEGLKTVSAAVHAACVCATTLVAAVSAVCLLFVV